MTVLRTSVVASRVYPHASVVMRGGRVGDGQCDYHVDMFLYGQLHQEGFESESFHTSSLPVFAALCTCSSTLASRVSSLSNGMCQPKHLVQLQACH